MIYGTIIICNEKIIRVYTDFGSTRNIKSLRSIKNFINYIIILFIIFIYICSQCKTNSHSNFCIIDIT